MAIIVKSRDYCNEFVHLLLFGLTGENPKKAANAMVMPMYVAFCV